MAQVHTVEAAAMASNNSKGGARSSRVNYGATATAMATTSDTNDSGESHHPPKLHVQIASPEASTVSNINGNGYFNDEYGDPEAEAEEQELLEASYRSMIKLYVLVPIVTVLFLLSLVALVTWGWPPSREERHEGQEYPHPIYWKAFLIGTFASFTVQSLRVPMFVAVSWLPLSGPWTVYVSSTLHALLHEATRMVSVPLTIPSVTSGFHSSYYLGLGWGVAECAWGIVQGWEQLALYEDVEPEPFCDDCNDETTGLYVQPFDPEDEAEAANDDLDELEHRVSILQRMQARNELEEVMGIPFPLIPLALHMLWRVDTLLLNLGLTLILSGFYFDPEPLYRHEPKLRDGGWQPSVPKASPSHWLPLAWCIVAAVHVALGLVWKQVGRIGVAPVTWGGLIVALASVFTGLGVWGGVV